MSNDHLGCSRVILDALGSFWVNFKNHDIWHQDDVSTLQMAAPDAISLRWRTIPVPRALPGVVQKFKHMIFMLCSWTRGGHLSIDDSRFSNGVVTSFLFWWCCHIHVIVCV